MTPRARARLGALAKLDQEKAAIAAGLRELPVKRLKVVSAVVMGRPARTFRALERDYRTSHGARETWRWLMGLARVAFMEAAITVDEEHARGGGS